MIDLINRYLERLRAAQKANDAARELLRASAESMLDPQVVLEAVRDPDGRVIDLAYRGVNRAACLFLGREEHELVTLIQLESLSNLEGSGLWETLVECLEVGTPLVLDDFPFRSDLFDGERRVDFRATKAGPGQKPARPQPMPNMAGPTIIRASTSPAVGRWNAPPKIGCARISTSLKPTKVTAMAPPITKARLGSQMPLETAPRSRKFSTFAGLDMPATTRPSPNTKPMAHCTSKDRTALTARAARERRSPWRSP